MLREIKPPAAAISKDDTSDPTNENEESSSIIPAAFHAQLSKKQLAFLEALLASSTVTITQASEAVGVTRKTGHLWLHQPAVAQALKAARQAMFDEALFTLQQAGQFAVAALLRNIGPNAPAAVQVRSAEIILDFKLKFEQVELLTERVAELEALLGPKPLRGSWPG